MSNWTEEQYNEFLKNQGKTTKVKKKPKYNNKFVTVDSHRFPSQKEADFYCNLKLLHRAREIKGFCRQPRFQLLGCEYVADFIIWHNNGKIEVIDTKGIKTDAYNIKIKEFKELYPDIEFREE